jgi:tetratricopeptide (TPR) repeat protein
MEAPMAGRTAWQLLLTGGLAAAAVGCGSTDKAPSWLNPSRSNNGPQVTPDPAFQAPSSEPIKASADVPRAKPGAGIKPDTDVAFADTQVEAAFAEGRAPAERDELLDHARQRYQKVLKADPKHKGAYLGLAKLYARLEDYPAAIGVYRQFLDKNPKDHAVHHDLAIVYGKAQDWVNASASCEAALALDPENRVYQKTLGMCLVRAGKYDEGYAMWLKVMPEAKARFFLARALEHTGQMDLVKQQVKLALAADPTYEPAISFFAYLNGEQSAPPPPPADAVQQTGFNQQ